MSEWTESVGVTIQMKAIEQFSGTGYYSVQGDSPFESVDEILKWELSGERY